jgi:hypothetical protein
VAPSIAASLVRSLCVLVHRCFFIRCKCKVRCMVFKSKQPSLRRASAHLFTHELKSSAHFVLRKRSFDQYEVQRRHSIEVVDCVIKTLSMILFSIPLPRL